MGQTSTQCRQDRTSRFYAVAPPRKIERVRRRKVVAGDLLLLAVVIVAVILFARHAAA